MKYQWWQHEHFSHLSPSRSCGHLQRNPPAASPMQLPPASHGFGSHGDAKKIAFSHRRPGQHSSKFHAKNTCFIAIVYKLSLVFNAVLVDIGIYMRSAWSVMALNSVACSKHASFSPKSISLAKKTCDGSWKYRCFKIRTQILWITY